jgi:hypothetical protein
MQVIPARGLKQWIVDFIVSVLSFVGLSIEVAMQVIPARGLKLER